MESCQNVGHCDKETTYYATVNYFFYFIRASVSVDISNVVAVQSPAVRFFFFLHCYFFFSPDKETDYELETSLEDSQDEYEGNKDAARALMRVKQKLDGYEEGEMRSIHGQVILYYLFLF